MQAVLPSWLFLLHFKMAPIMSTFHKGKRSPYKGRKASFCLEAWESEIKWILKGKEYVCLWKWGERGKSIPDCGSQCPKLVTIRSFPFCVYMMFLTSTVGSNSPILEYGLILVTPSNLQSKIPVYCVTSRAWIESHATSVYSVWNACSWHHVVRKPRPHREAHVERDQGPPALSPG